MPFKPGHDPNRNAAGRPRGRIAKFRAMLGDSTRDGQEMVDELTAIWRDKETPARERLAALELGLAYLLGKPESSVSIDAEVTARTGPQLDGAALIASLPLDVVREVNRAIEENPKLLIAAPDDESVLP